MRSNTRVNVGIRNIGDARDTGDFFEGSLKEALAFLIQKISQISVARRISIVIARSHDEVMTGLELKRGRTYRGGADLVDLLESISFEDSEDETESLNQPTTIDPRDDYGR